MTSAEERILRISYPEAKTPCLFESRFGGDNNMRAVPYSYSVYKYLEKDGEFPVLHSRVLDSQWHQLTVFGGTATITVCHDSKTIRREPIAAKDRPIRLAVAPGMTYYLTPDDPKVWVASHCYGDPPPSLHLESQRLCEGVTSARLPKLGLSWVCPLAGWLAVMETISFKDATMPVKGHYHLGKDPSKNWEWLLAFGIVRFQAWIGESWLCNDLVGEENDPYQPTLLRIAPGISHAIIVEKSSPRVWLKEPRRTVFNKNAPDTYHVAFPSVCDPTDRSQVGAAIWMR